MGKYFTKLNQKFKTPKYAETTPIVHYGIALDYYIVELQYPDDFLKYVPERYRDDFMLLFMRANTYVPPHTDSNIQCTINFYMKTDNCRTQFYKFKTDDVKKMQLDAQTNGFYFDVNDLEQTESFVAENNEAWVLNVAEPHAVLAGKRFIERNTITLSTMKYNYDEVIEMLKETGYIDAV